MEGHCVLRKPRKQKDVRHQRVAHDPTSSLFQNRRAAEKAIVMQMAVATNVRLPTSGGQLDRHALEGWGLPTSYEVSFGNSGCVSGTSISMACIVALKQFRKFNQGLAPRKESTN